MGFLDLVGEADSTHPIQLATQRRLIRNGAGTQLLEYDGERAIDKLLGGVREDGFPSGSRVRRYTTANAGTNHHIRVRAAKNLDVDLVRTFQHAELHGEPGGLPQVDHRGERQLPELLRPLGEIAELEEPDPEAESAIGPLEKVFIDEFRDNARGHGLREPGLTRDLVDAESGLLTIERAQDRSDTTDHRSWCVPIIGTHMSSIGALAGSMDRSTPERRSHLKEEPMSEPLNPAPATEDAVTRVAAASADWATTPAAERARVIGAIADALDAEGNALISIAQEETSLPQPRLAGELKRTTFQLRLFAEVIDHGGHLDVRIDRPDPAWPMGAPRPDLRRILVPIGPVLVFAASNFPFAFSVAGGDTAAALAAGNAVVVKAHSGHPRLSEATATVVTSAATRAGAPADLLRVIHGTEQGVAALQHPAIKAASFTGSIPAGRALFDIANARPEPIPFYGELGSVNPAFVTPDAAGNRGAEIAAEYLASVTGSQGQLCTKPGILFVPAGSPVLDALRDAPGSAPAPMLNDRILHGFVDSLDALAEQDGVAELRGGESGRATEPMATLLTTTIDRVLEDPEALIAEVFGPAGLVVTYTDPSDLEDVARKLDGQLTATLIAEETEADLDLARTLVPVLTDRAGRLLWNQWPTGVSVTGAQQHGGPYPATTASTTTAVGTASINRFLRPVAYQNFPAALLPEALRDDNPLGVPQTIDG